jgi:hypothetical protein
MSRQEPNCRGELSVLAIHAPAEASERPIPVEIKVVRIDGLGQSTLPARLSRPRCGQKARQTVEPAPRQIELINE